MTFAEMTLEQKVNHLAKLLGIYETPADISLWMYSPEGIAEFRAAQESMKRGNIQPMTEYMQKTGYKFPDLRRTKI